MAGAATFTTSSSVAPCGAGAVAAEGADLLAAGGVARGFTAEDCALDVDRPDCRSVSQARAMNATLPKSITLRRLLGLIAGQKAKTIDAMMPKGKVASGK